MGVGSLHTAVEVHADAPPCRGTSCRIRSFSIGANLTSFTLMKWEEEARNSLNLYIPQHRRLSMDHPTAQRVHRIAQRILVSSGIGVLCGEEGQCRDYANLEMQGWPFTVPDSDIVGLFPTWSAAQNSFAGVLEHDTIGLYSFITATPAALLSALTRPAMQREDVKELIAQRQHFLGQLSAAKAAQMKKWEVVVTEETTLVSGSALADLNVPGVLIITKGMVEYCHSDNEIAAALSHSAFFLFKFSLACKLTRRRSQGIGHIVARHFDEHISHVASLSGWIHGRIYGELSLHVDFHRDRSKATAREIEADCVALRLMARAMYDPNALFDLEQRMMTDRELASRERESLVKRKQKNWEGTIKYFVHPMTPNRYEVCASLLEGELTTLTYHFVGLTDTSRQRFGSILRVHRECDAGSHSQSGWRLATALYSAFCAPGPGFSRPKIGICGATQSLSRR